MRTFFSSCPIFVFTFNLSLLDPVKRIFRHRIFVYRQRRSFYSFFWLWIRCYFIPMYPCTSCNEVMKFVTLLQKLLRRVVFIATKHGIEAEYEKSRRGRTNRVAVSNSRK